MILESAISEIRAVFAEFNNITDDRIFEQLAKECFFDQPKPPEQLCVLYDPAVELRALLLSSFLLVVQQQLEVICKNIGVAIVNFSSQAHEPTSRIPLCGVDWKFLEQEIRDYGVDQKYCDLFRETRKPPRVVLHFGLIQGASCYEAQVSTAENAEEIKNGMIERFKNAVQEAKESIEMIEDLSDTERQRRLEETAKSPSVWFVISLGSAEKYYKASESLLFLLDAGFKNARFPAQ